MNYEVENMKYERSFPVAGLLTPHVEAFIIQNGCQYFHKK
jgi:hypothetical protein